MVDYSRELLKADIKLTIVSCGMQSQFVRPDQINVLVVGFPYHNYPESECKKKIKIPTTSLKNVHVRRHALFFHLKNPRQPI